MAANRQGPEATHPRTESFHTRPLPRPENHQGQSGARGDHFLVQGFSRAMHRTESTTGNLVPHSDGQIYVLEDNLRCPSGVSYVLENRRLMKSLFPEVFNASHIMPVSNYPIRLRDMLEYLAPDGVASPRVVLLTPGVYNSAY